MNQLTDPLTKLKFRLQAELTDILTFWMTRTVDQAHGGFYGRIDGQDHVYPEAPKGSVLNARILWAFSAASIQSPEPGYLDVAHRAFHYLKTHFVDPEYGGIYWTVDYLGRPLDTKKQIYALAFAVYGFTEYHKVTGSPEALALAIDLYQAIEAHSFDPGYTGYIDAFARDWEDLEDIRLSEKDQKDKKTMNTHLHILEAYTALYAVWPDEGLKEKLRLLIDNFSRHILDHHTKHLILFFDERWAPRSEVISFGHDIEASWLLQEAARVVGDASLEAAVRKMSLELAEAAAEGLDSDGGLWNEKAGGRLVEEKHWWPQAEAMVGFLNAYENTDDQIYLTRVLGVWRFIEAKLRSATGEWIWGIDAQHTPLPGMDKAGLWKCPYHNSRACLEVLKRLQQT